MSSSVLPGTVATGGTGSYQDGSLGSNPTVGPIDLTVHGSDFLWAIFACMLATSLGVTAWAYSRPQGHRAFHACTMMLLFTASIAYFSMASDLGATPVPVEFNRIGSLYSGTLQYPNRSIWYVRYIDWVITTPLLLLTLLLGTGMPTSNIVFIIFMDLVMIVTGLVGALVHSQYKWGYFTFGCVAMLFVFWGLIGPGRAGAYALGPAYGKAYFTSALVLSFLWFLYPIAWGLADGGNVISTDGEMVFYGILDLLAKPCYTVFHLYTLSKLDYARFGFKSGHFSSGYETVINEKGALNGTHHHHRGAEAAVVGAGAAGVVQHEHHQYEHQHQHEHQHATAGNGMPPPVSVHTSGGPTSGSGSATVV